MLRTRSETKEWLCILLGAGIGAYLSWWLRSIWAKAIAIIAAINSTILITYLAFLQGWWLPILPIAIAIILAGILIEVLTQRRSATMQLTETVRQIQMISRSQSTVIKIALELLKQGESQKNKAVIEEIVNR